MTVLSPAVFCPILVCVPPHYVPRIPLRDRRQNGKRELRQEEENKVCPKADAGQILEFKFSFIRLQVQTSGQRPADAGPGGLVLFPLFSLPGRGVLGPSVTCPGPGPRSRVTALLSLILVSPLLLHLLSGHFHDTYPIPEVPEGGWTWHHQRGDH